MKYNHIELAIMFVQQSGPVTRHQITGWIRSQSVTSGEPTVLADEVISHGLSRGWLKQDEEYYCIG